MKFFYRIYIGILLFASSCTVSNAQCTGGTSQGSLTPTTLWQTIGTQSDYYYTFSAVAGNAYMFSYCSCEGGSISYDAEITILKNNTVVTGDNIWTNYNSGFCAGTYNAPRVTWKCPTSGTYRVLTTEQYCLTTSGLTATMAYKMETPSLCYSVGSTAYLPDTYGAGTAVSGMNVDDGISPSINIGFSFCFNGTYYSKIFVSSNGYITFVGSCPSVTECNTNNFPSSSYTMETLPFTNTTYTAFIGPGVLFPWIDAYPVGGGTIAYKVYGTSPNRHLTVSYEKVEMFSCNAKLITSEVQLYETSNNIEIQSKDIPQCAAWTPPGGQGVEGLIDETGFAAVVPPGRNLTSWTAGTEAWLFTPACCSVLPIQLLNFDCSTVAHGIKVNWSTASEVNNSYFTIERSADGINFLSIARVAGAGNSDHTLYYSYTDTNTLNGINYYKLLQTDYDGKTTEFYTTACTANHKVAGAIYPNPSGGIFTLTLSPSTQPTTVTINNILGQTVYTASFQSSATYTSPVISVQQLSKGLYFLRINNGQLNIVRKLVLR